MFELFQFTYWSQILNNKILAWTFESTDFFFFNVCVLFIVCTFWQSLAIRANKVSRGTMRMVCLTSLASAAKWSWAVWGLFWRETRRPLSRAVDQMNCATFSPHKHTLAPSGESESGRRLTNPLKICQIASFPRRVRGFFLFFFFFWFGAKACCAFTFCRRYLRYSAHCSSGLLLPVHEAWRSWYLRGKWFYRSSDWQEPNLWSSSVPAIRLKNSKCETDWRKLEFYFRFWNSYDSFSIWIYSVGSYWSLNWTPNCVFWFAFRPSVSFQTFVGGGTCYCRSRN